MEASVGPVMEDEDYAPLDGNAAGIFARGMEAAEASFAEGIDELSDAAGAMGALTALSSVGLWPRPLLPVPVCSLLGSGLGAEEQAKQLGEEGEEKGGEGQEDEGAADESAESVHIPSIASLQPLSKEEADARCSLCKDLLDVDLVASEAICPPPAEPSRSKAGQDQMPTAKECKAFSNAGASCSAATPAHKSSRERCLAMVKQAKEEFGAIKKAFKERACVCMGCCAEAGGGGGTQIGVGGNEGLAGAGSEPGTCFHATVTAAAFNGAVEGGTAAEEAGGGVLDGDEREEQELLKDDY